MYSKQKSFTYRIYWGEPFLRNDLEEIIEYTSSLGVSTSIATNGTLLTEKRMDRLYHSGLQELQISLESPDRDTNDYIRGAGTYDRVLKSLEIAKKYDVKIVLAMTINRLNYSHIGAFVQLVEKYQLDLARFELFVPLGNGEKNIENLGLLPEHIENISEIISSNLGKTNIRFPLISAQRGCGAGEIFCVINSDFSVSPCDLLASVAKTKPINNMEDLIYVWNNSNTFIDWRNIRVADNHCKQCKSYLNCKYGCRAVSFAYTKSMNNADVLCLSKVRG